MASHREGNDLSRTRRTTALAAGALLIALASASCGSGTKSATTPQTPARAGSGETPEIAKTLGVGVTDKTVKLGITYVDLEGLAAVPEVTQIRENQEEVYQAFIKEMNTNGGVGGRQVVPVFKKYIPEIPGQVGLIATCTALTEDDNVSATLGTYYDPSGDAQLCMTKQHKRVLVTFDLDRSILEAAPPGLIVTPGVTPERSVKILFDLLDKQHALDGKKVGIMGNELSAIVENAVLPSFERLGVDVGAVGYLSLNNGTDTTTAESQLDSLIEKWKGQKVDTIFISSKEVAALRFVSKLRKALPDVQLLADDGQVLGYGQGADRYNITPNPYEGTIVTSGPTRTEYEHSPNWEYCKDIYEETHKKAPGPNEIIPYKNMAGKTSDTYGAINDSCQLLTMFRDIGDRVTKQYGGYLNNENWVNAVNNFGHIRNVGSGPYASLGAGKYEADDGFRLVQFDSSLPPNGNWKALTPLQNLG